MAVELSTTPGDEFGNLVSGLDGYIEDCSPGFSKFLQLPLELREKIYMQYLVAGPFQKPPHGTSIAIRSYRKLNHRPDAEYRVGCWPYVYIANETYEPDLPVDVAKFMPPLALTSHQVRSEVCRVMLRHCEKIVLAGEKAPGYAKQFLSSFYGCWPFELIRVFDFPEFQIFRKNSEYSPGNTAFDFLARCPNVHTLVLTFRPIDFCYNDPEVGWQMRSSLEPTLDEYELGRIVDCENLRWVCLIMPLKVSDSIWYNYKEGLKDSPDYFGKSELLGKWIKDGFRERGKDVKVSTRHTTHFNTGGIDELAGLRELGVWMKERLSEDVVVSVVSRKDV
jgi:hypothetical protein